MLGMNKYTREYIDACRARVDADLAAYRAVAAITRQQPGGEAALAALETTFFNNMTMLLDYYFVNRLRTLEGKDGNPLNEVRVNANSLLQNGGVLATTHAVAMESNKGDKSVKLVPAKTVLGQEIGDQVRITEAEFVRLSDAYFAEMERRFAE